MVADQVLEIDVIELLRVAAQSSDQLAAQMLLKLAIIATVKDNELQEKQQEIEVLEAELENARDDSESAAENVRERLRLMDKIRTGIELHLDELELA